MSSIRYVGNGREQPSVKISFSMNAGKSWREQELRAGQTFPIPPTCDALLISGVPYDPKGDYEIREGKVGRK
ncbi:MAG: hypothetical protein HDQ93_06520 [Desulfovibrio sp.]|nr:hypothetical protein [Desulfovibrio sp.]